MASKVTKKITTNKVRFSYANVFEPVAPPTGGKERYSVSIIVPKSDKEGVAKIQKAIDDCINENAQSFFGGKTKGLKIWFRDGDEERDDEAYANSYFFSANTFNKPGIVDESLNAIIDPNEFYSGTYGRASITVFPYDSNGARGIAFGLQHLQKLEDGERLGGGSSAASDFAD